MGGVNDLTVPQYYPGMPRTFRFDWGSSQHLVETMGNLFDTEISKLKTRHPTAKIAVCSLVAMNLSRTVTNVTQDRQDLLNVGIWELNNRIFHLNRFLGHHGPLVIQTCTHLHSKRWP